MRGKCGGVAGSQPTSTAVPVHRSPNKLGRTIFNLWQASSLHQVTVTLLPLEAKRVVYRLHRYRCRNIKMYRLPHIDAVTEAFKLVSVTSLSLLALNNSVALVTLP